MKRVEASVHNVALENALGSAELTIRIPAAELRSVLDRNVSGAIVVALVARDGEE